MKQRLFNTLQAKFLAGLTMAALAVGLLFMAGFYAHMREILDQEVRDKAQLIFFQVDAVQNYVRQSLRPKMFEELGETFILEAMSSSYISRAIMDRTREKAGSHVYRRVARGARNPYYEAQPLEREFIEYFRQHPKETLWQGYKTLAGGDHFVMARPVRFAKSCMTCHGKPEDAPADILEKYGDRGFGHALNSVDGVDFVGLPVSSSVIWIKERVLTYLLFFVVAAGMFFTATNMVYNRVVVASLHSLTQVFRKNVSDDEGSQLLREVQSKDELAALMDGMERLGEHLFSTRSQLQDYATNLEGMVAERTAELSEQAAKRQEDVNLFVGILAALGDAQTRPQLWPAALPLIAERFDLERIGFVCTFGSHRSYVWPESAQRPELPGDWLELATHTRPRIQDGTACIPVASSKGNTEGMLILHRQPGKAFRQHDQVVLKAVARQLGIAAEHLDALDNMLRHSANLQSIFEGITDPLLLVDVAGGVVVTNEAARGLARELCAGRVGDLLTCLCQEGGCDITAAAREGRFIFREVRMHGGRSFAINLFPVREGMGRVVAFVRETTTEKRMMEQVTRSEKMATVGKLAAGLAHEINNPLGVILFYAELLQNAGLDEQQREDVQVIVKHTRQAKQVLGDLLNFARPKASTDKQTDVGTVCTEVASVFKVQAEKRGITISVDAKSGVPGVQVEAQALEHIMANLLLNALDALDSGTADGASGPEQGRIGVHITYDARQQEVVLTVEDNGPGVPPSDLQRIFDPFFTTKEVGSGSGLGLAVVYGFMADLGGSVEASNRESGGARFELRFPARSASDATNGSGGAA